MISITLRADEPVHFPGICPVCLKVVPPGETTTLVHTNPTDPGAAPREFIVPVCKACSLQWDAAARYNRISQRVIALMMIALLGVCGVAYKIVDKVGWGPGLALGLIGAAVLLCLAWLVTLPFRPPGAKFLDFDAPPEPLHLEFDATGKGLVFRIHHDAYGQAMGRANGLEFEAKAA